MAGPDYKSMYFHLAGRMAVAVDSMEVIVDSLKAVTAALESNAISMQALTEKLKNAQQATEEMFIDAEDADEA